MVGRIAATLLAALTCLAIVWTLRSGSNLPNKPGVTVEEPALVALDVGSEKPLEPFGLESEERLIVAAGGSATTDNGIVTATDDSEQAATEPVDEIEVVREIVRKGTGSDKSRFLAAFRYHQKEVYMKYMEDRFLAGLADDEATARTEQALDQHLSGNAYLGGFEEAEVTCSAEICFIDIFAGTDYAKVANVLRSFLPGWRENTTFVQVVPIEIVSEGIHRMYIVREDIDLSDLTAE